MARATTVQFGDNLLVSDEGDGVIQVTLSDDTPSGLSGRATTVQFGDGFDVFDLGDGVILVNVGQSDTGDSAGRATTIRWGAGITATDEGGGVIRLDAYIPPGGDDGYIGNLLTISADCDEGGSDVLGYNVYRANASGDEILVARGISSGYVDIVPVGETYFYTVTAVNAIGEGDPSNEDSVVR